MTAIPNTSHLLQVLLFQFEPKWEDKSQNLQQIENVLKGMKPGTELVILPEMATTGFSMNATELAEEMEGDSFIAISKMAVEYQVAICGSFIVQEFASFYNRFIFFHPDGKWETYDKKHLFTMGAENKTYTSGTARKIIQYKGWKILPIICYDLRFPVWCRNNLNYDLIICVANWPSARTFVWNTLLKARAIENQCYVLGCNRIGTDGNQIQHDGNSLILDAKGQVMAEAKNQEEMLYAILNKKVQNDFRAAFPVLKDGDSFQLI